MRYEFFYPGNEFRIQQSCNDLSFTLTFESDGMPFNDKHSCQQIEFTGELLYPKGSGLNQNNLEAQRRSNLWAVKHGLISDSKIPKLEGLKSASLFCSSLSNGTIDDLQIMADFTVFLFLFDDIVDKQRCKDPSELKKVLDIFYNLLDGKYSDGKYPDSTFPCYSALCAALADIRDRLLQRKDDLHFFIKSVQGYFKGVLSESERKYITTSVQTHLHRRKYSGAVRTIFEILCILKKIDVSVEDRSNVDLKRLTNAANNVIFLLNDILSFYKEMKEKDHENLVLVKFNELVSDSKDKLSNMDCLKKSFSFVLNLYNEEIREFIKIYSNIPEDHVVKRYAKLMLDCMHDHVRWSFEEETSRYELDLDFKLVVPELKTVDGAGVYTVEGEDEGAPSLCHSE